MHIRRVIGILLLIAGVILAAFKVASTYNFVFGVFAATGLGFLLGWVRFKPLE